VADLHDNDPPMFGGPRTPPGSPRSARTLPTEAFAYANFRRFFVGQAVSNIGTWFQMVAQALLVLKITGRASSLGEVLAVQTLPMLCLGPFIGPLLDRTNIRRLLIIVSIVAGTEAALLGALTASHHVTITWILSLSFVLGFAQMFVLPSNQAFLPQLVPPTAIANAVGYSSVQMTVGRLAGPAAAALLYAWKGAATCYFVNSASYALVLVALLSLHRSALRSKVTAGRSPRQFAEAFAFVRSSILHKEQLGANVVIGCLAFNFPIFFSSFTQQVLHAGSFSFGVAETANAAGAMLMGLILSRKLRNPTRRTYLLGCCLLGGSLVNAGLAPNAGIFYLDMVLFGASLVVYQISNQIILQKNTPPSRLGSVMALSSYGSQGTTPIGSLITGGLITLGTARLALAVGGASAIVCALVLFIFTPRPAELVSQARAEQADDLSSPAEDSHTATVP
jgi:MFS family permease